MSHTHPCDSILRDQFGSSIDHSRYHLSLCNRIRFIILSIRQDDRRWNDDDLCPLLHLSCVLLAQS